MSVFGFTPRLTRTGDWQRPARPANGPAAASTAISRPLPRDLKQQFRNLGFTMAIVVLSNVMSHSFFNPHILFMNTGSATAGFLPSFRSSGSGELYLTHEAAQYIPDTKKFEKKVRQVAKNLNVPAEWLMAVMYSESKFNPAAVNFKGSGATGLIQFMPATALELNTTTDDLLYMNPVEQMDYVYAYLDGVRRRHGDFKTVTQLYLAILFPKAVSEEVCYTLYASPSQAYRQNSGLDEDKDGRVTVYDVDRRLLRLYPEAYHASLPQS